MGAHSKVFDEFHVNGHLNMYMVKGCEGGLNYNDLTGALPPGARVYK